MKNSRRNFIKQSGVLTAGLAMSFGAKSYANIMGANDRVRVGIVGFSDRMRYSLIPSFLHHNKDLNFDIVAISDIWNRRREEGAAYIAEKTGKKDIFKARNNEELYEKGQFDAVIVATADFQHATHCIEAVTAGKDAYVEKPFAESMEDNRNAYKAVRQSKKIVQIGTQRRSAGNYAKAYEYIKSGKFGEITMVEMCWNVNQPGRWRRPQLVKEIRQEDTDWQRFLINRPQVEWDPRKYLEYRLFYPYSSGIPSQWMCHQIDTVHWFSGYEFPRSVVANGGVYFWKDGRVNADTLTAVFDYGPKNDPSKGFQVLYTSRMHNEANGIKELYFSNGGMINLDTNKVTSEGGLQANFAKEMGMGANLLPELSLAEDVKVETNANTGGDPMTSAHVKNWMECVRSRKEPNASVRAGYCHSIATMMTTLALHTGKRVTFDDTAQDISIS
jgi:predicted dehydrogenase